MRLTGLTIYPIKWGLVVDQETLERGKEPLRTLATFRNVNGKVMFGQNVIHDGPGRQTLGDAVTLLP